MPRDARLEKNKRNHALLNHGSGRRVASLWASGATRSAKVIMLFEGAPLQDKSL